MQAKLIVAFDRLSDADFITKSGTIVAALTGNVNYPEPWLPQIASLVELTNALADYEVAYHGALSKDILKVSHRESSRLALTDILKKMAPYLEVVAQGNIDVLVTTGYDLRRDTTHASSFDPLPAPADFKVLLGDFSGSLDIKISRLLGAASYDVQITQLDPTVEANWAHTATSKTSSHIQLTGLTPGQSYWLRMRGIGTNGVGLWTEPLNIMVV